MKFLVGEMNKYITGAKAHLFNEMQPNRDTCVLRYLVDGHRPLGRPQDRKACLTCSVLTPYHRPCALLLEVDGVRTVVFMPLHMSGEHKWIDKGYWVTDAD